MNSFIALLKSFGPARLAAMGAVALSLTGIFVFLMLRFSAPQYVPLFSDLAPEESSSILKELDSQAVAYQTKGDGSVILVSKADVSRLRMKLAEKGLPKAGVGYEIFDKTDALGSTSFVQNINHLRALEGELSRSIRTIARISSARVHLVVPERQLFQKEKSEPSASIVLKLNGSLDGGHIRAIQHLVSSAVDGLKPSKVSIVDESGRLLASGKGEDGGAALLSSLEEKQQSVERKLLDQVDAIVSSVVGAGRARVQVAVDLERNRITQTQDLFDPEGRVVRSSQSRNEKASSTEPARDGEVSASTELPGQSARGGANPAQSRENNDKTEEIVNYEISRTTRTEVVEAGRLKRLSVAVLVDGIYQKGQTGDVTYQPRPQEQLDQIATLVRSAIGFDQARGDQVQVVNMRFADAPHTLAAAVEEKGLFGFGIKLDQSDIFKVAETVVLMILSIIVVLVVVRPLVKQVLSGQEPTPSIAQIEATQIQETEKMVADKEAHQAQLLIEDETQKKIELAQALGNVRAQTMQKVSDIVQQNPKETVHVIRQWLSEGSPS